MDILRNRFHAFVSLLISSLAIAAAEVDLSKLPPASSRKPDFIQDIYPIFTEHCICCHGPEKQKGKNAPDRYEGRRI